MRFYYENIQYLHSNTINAMSLNPVHTHHSSPAVYTTTLSACVLQ